MGRTRCVSEHLSDEVRVRLPQRLTGISWNPSSGELINPSYFDRGDIHLEDRDEFIEDFWVRKYPLISRPTARYRHEAES